MKKMLGRVTASWHPDFPILIIRAEVSIELFLGYEQRFGVDDWLAKEKLAAAPNLAALLWDRIGRTVSVLHRYVDEAVRHDEPRAGGVRGYHVEYPR